MKKAKRSSSRARSSRSRRLPSVSVMGRHSLPDVCRRPNRSASAPGSGRSSAGTPIPRSAAAKTTAASLIVGRSTRSPERAISPIVALFTVSRSGARGGRRSPAARCSRTQCRNASTRVFVPASPAWPSVSITENGFPSMRSWTRWWVKLSGPQE
jgi:hypothetical protein